MDSNSDADNGPTSALRCSHGNLLADAPGARRVSVPESLWIFLCDTNSASKADNIVTFSSDCPPCELCDQNWAVVAVNLR